MKKGDLCFLSLKYRQRNSRYSKGHKEAYLDPTDKLKKFVAVQVRFERN